MSGYPLSCDLAKPLRRGSMEGEEAEEFSWGGGIGGMNELLLRQCDRNVLLDVVKRLYSVVQRRSHDLSVQYDNQFDVLDCEAVENIIHDSLLKMKLAAKSQQDEDQNAFRVVLGGGVAGETEFQMTEAGNRKRFSTGLLVVGDDALSFISTFLSCEKVELQREWKVPGSSMVCGAPHGPSVDSCHFSPCSTKILTGSGNDLHLWDAISGLLIRTFKPGHAEGTDDSIHSCRFFPDGKTVVSASTTTITTTFTCGKYEMSAGDHTLKVWDVASGSLVRTLTGHKNRVTCVDVAPDNARVLSGSYDKTWKLWNSRTGELQHTQHVIFPGTSAHPARWDSEHISCCSFSPDGRLLLVGCGKKLMLHDSTTYQLQHTLADHFDLVTSCSFTPDGDVIMSGSDDCTIKLWSAIDGDCFRSLVSGNLMGVLNHSVRKPQSCFFSPTGHEVCSASMDGTLMMCEGSTGRLESAIDKNHQAPGDLLLSICASPDGNYIASGHFGGTVKMWRVGWKVIAPITFTCVKK